MPNHVDVETPRQSVTIRVGGHPVTFTADQPVFAASGDAEFALNLIPAMMSGDPLTIDDPVSPRLLRNFSALQGVLDAFFGLTRIEVQATPGSAAVTPASGVGSFFSGGVDSFYTARSRDDIDWLIFVHGFDIGLDDEGLREEASAAARAAAEKMGKRFVEITTDMRSIEVITANWVWYHGAAMAGVGHLLSPIVGRVYIPASYTYRDTFPWGSHPVLDPMWSGGAVEFVHDGAEATRFDKIGAIAGDDVAARHLRVCWENRDGQYNCGECEKCVRTMIELRAHGALERFVTFDRPLNLRRVRFGELTTEGQVAFTLQALRRLEETDGDPEVMKALRWRLWRSRITHVVRRIGGPIKRRLIRRS